MRVVETVDEEKYIGCPECKRLLAYTKDDIRLSTQFVKSNSLLKTSHYIDCPVCGYLNLIKYEEFVLK